MSYAVEYINCKICGSDQPKFLGFRGNLEYMDAPRLNPSQEHMATAVVKCRKCGFVYTNPKIIVSAEKEPCFYKEPERYYSSVCSDPLKVFDKALNLIQRFSNKMGRLLDVGAGKGEFLAAAKMQGWEVFGVEPSLNFVRYAKEKYGVDIRNSSLEEANFPDNFFDAVALNMVLEHIEDPHSMFSAIHRVLKADGLLYIEAPNMSSGLLKIINFYYRLTRRGWSPLLSPLHPPYHCYGYQASSLRMLCRMNNFAVKKIFIFGIGLRGFRSFGNNSKFKGILRIILARTLGAINRGDILIAIANKK